MKTTYRMSFDPGGLLLFLAIMLPNIIWFAIPAPHDVLRGESSTQTLDTIASVCQVLLIIALCIPIRTNTKYPLHKSLLLSAILCCLLYYTSWGIYYCGNVQPIVILALCVMPCLAFLFYAVSRRNWLAVLPISLFMICHTAYGIINFI